MVEGFPSNIQQAKDWEKFGSNVNLVLSMFDEKNKNKNTDFYKNLPHLLQHYEKKKNILKVKLQYLSLTNQLSNSIFVYDLRLIAQSV